MGLSPFPDTLIIAYSRYICNGPWDIFELSKWSTLDLLDNKFNANANRHLSRPIPPRYVLSHWENIFNITLYWYLSLWVSFSIWDFDQTPDTAWNQKALNVLLMIPYPLYTSLIVSLPLVIPCFNCFIVSFSFLWHNALAWVGRLLMAAPLLPRISLWSRRRLWFVPKSSDVRRKTLTLSIEICKAIQTRFLFNHWPSDFFISFCSSRYDS